MENSGSLTKYLFCAGYFSCIVPSQMIPLTHFTALGGRVSERLSRLPEVPQPGGAELDSSPSPCP